jgi:hypothetical protein
MRRCRQKYEAKVKGSKDRQLGAKGRNDGVVNGAAGITLALFIGWGVFGFLVRVFA